MKYFIGVGLVRLTVVEALESILRFLGLWSATFAFRFRLSPRCGRAVPGRSPVPSGPAAAPPIMRAISSTRFSPVNRFTLVTVRRPWTFFSIRKWLRPHAAICGRWVMQRTWKRSPSDASFCPTTVATRPPMPASTSSKIRVLAAPASAAASVFKASMTRDSSPPDTILASGRRSSPTFGDRNNSPLSMPASVHCPSDSEVVSRTSNLVRSIARSASSASTSFANRGAASRRLADSFLAAVRNVRPASPSCCSISATVDCPPVSAVCSAVSRSRWAIASSSVPPCLRFSRSISARRSSTSCNRAGDASMLSVKSRSVKARSSSCALIPSRASRYGAKRGSIAASSPTRFQTRPRTTSAASSVS